MGARITTIDGAVHTGPTVPAIVARVWPGARLVRGKGELGTWSVVEGDYVLTQLERVEHAVHDADTDLMRAQMVVEHLQADLAEASQQRDTIIRGMVEHGTSMYAVAQATGLSQPAVAKIVRA